MKKQLALIGFGLVLATHGSSFAIMDVTDGKALYEAVKHNASEVRHWKEQLEHYRATISHFTNLENTLKDQLASFSGIRTIGELEGQLSSLMYELKGIERHRSMLNDMLGSRDPEISSEADAILGKYQMFDVCEGKGSRRLDNICKEEVLNKAGTLETSDKIKKKMEGKMKEVQKLSRKAAMSKDVKESQDIANAIALKQTEIDQLEHQWRLSVDEANLREKLIEKKRMQAFNEQQLNAPSPNIIFK